MAIFKCKMCGGDLNITESVTVAECEYCGSTQTVPSADNEKKMTLFARANRLRAGCEFDKAAGVYEAIVADFPEEAEAYWGLVLCKYGIEYVDDTATGKKIPTCHRSSFNSVLEDSDFEQACENADAYARRIYRDEAKAIENLRRGIIAVSANEQPYDIFICYKETAENGERTLDSVLAQEIYDALTGKSYRVFFARITLEDKLGVEYEPYIFAALNSAKIMLAVGTDYEYYNAVWVKNEWSRYLKLMEQDKGKHLIPCFKGLDAYDMPKEFARLQAQDMGKVGAMQDLLRGIEKIIPHKQPVAVVQEKAVVGGSGDNKIVSLLDRGNMALEDGDWAKADSFFEDVLNNDSKNAQAYLGKTLAQENCATLATFIQKRKNAALFVTGQTLFLEPDTNYINAKALQFSLPDYVEEDAILALYDCDLSYHSDVTERRQQYQNEERYWANHRQLSRAEKFAEGELAEELAREKKALFAALSDRVKKAEVDEAAAIKRVQENYIRYTQQVDAQAEALYQDGIERREADYQSFLQIAKTSCDVEELTVMADNFEALGDYQDSKNLAEHCCKRAAEEQAKLDAEAERQRVLQEKAESDRIARNRKIGIISCTAAIAILAAAVVVTKVVIPHSKYNEAIALMDAGQYEEAIAAFEAMNGFKDSVEQIEDCEIAVIDEKYSAACKLMTARRYEEAIVAFEELNGYRDSAEQISACETANVEMKYNNAVDLSNRGDIAQAALIFANLNYLDSNERSAELWDEITVRKTIDCGGKHVVGLQSNGKVVAVGNNGSGQCDVSKWEDIVAIAAGSNHTVGLKSDGTVVAVGANAFGQCDVSNWRGIVAIDAGDGSTYGLRIDGTVVAVGENGVHQCNLSGWGDITAVSAGYRSIVGLRADGTVVARGFGGYGVSDWSNIIAVATGKRHIVGLALDGTVNAANDNDKGQCNVSEWTDVIAISAGYCHTIGIKSDGAVLAVGDNAYGQCNVSGWADIVTVTAGESQTVGLKSDGTVVAVGDNTYGQCNVKGWRNIKLPN